MAAVSTGMSFCWPFAAHAVPPLSRLPFSKHCLCVMCPAKILCVLCVLCLFKLSWWTKPSVQRILARNIEGMRGDADPNCVAQTQMAGSAGRAADVSLWSIL